MGFSRKIQTRGLGDVLFWKTPLEFLDLSLNPQKFRRKQAFTSENSAKLWHTPWKFQSQKPRPIPHEFFLNIPGNSTSFFKWPLQFPHALYSIPLKIQWACPRAPVWIFFWIAYFLPTSSFPPSVLTCINCNYGGYC